MSVVKGNIHSSYVHTVPPKSRSKRFTLAQYCTGEPAPFLSTMLPCTKQMYPGHMRAPQNERMDGWMYMDTNKQLLAGLVSGKERNLVLTTEWCHHLYLLKK